MLSFTEQDDRTVVVRRERLCDSCAGQEAADTMELEGFLDALSKFILIAKKPNAL